VTDWEQRPHIEDACVGLVEVTRTTLCVRVLYGHYAFWTCRQVAIIANNIGPISLPKLAQR